MAFITDEHVSPPLEKSLQVLVSHILYTIVKRIMVIIQKKLEFLVKILVLNPELKKVHFRKCLISLTKGLLSQGPIMEVA